MATAYLVQGLHANTLVAGKTTALRMITAPWGSVGVTAVLLTVVRPDGSVLRLTQTTTEFVVVDAGADTESIVVRLPGRSLPDVGDYYIQAILQSAIGTVLARYNLDAVSLLQTKDLRMMVSRAYPGVGEFELKGEAEAAKEAMVRLAALYPIRDGISVLNGDRAAGLRFNFDNDPEAPPNQDGNLGPSWDTFQNPGDGQDGLDAALVYRFPRFGDTDDKGNHYAFGASTRSPYNGWLPWSLIVWDPPLAHAFCHETGHNHGLEDPSSPHFDSGGQAAHSKDLHIDPTDSGNGFDLEFNQAFPPDVLDLMYPTGSDPGEPPVQLSLNAFDWEFVRKKLIARNSTGPHGPSINWQSLGGHDLIELPCAARNADGRIEVFVIGSDLQLYHIWETGPSLDWYPSWKSLGGNPLVGPIRTALNPDGRLWVFVRGLDQQIHARVQSQVLPGSWDPWIRIGGMAVKDFAVLANANGLLELVSVYGDGALYDTTQIAGFDGFMGWQSLGGVELQGSVQLGRNARGNVQVFVLGGNGNIYSRAQVQPGGATGWSDWTPLLDPSQIAVQDFRVQSGGDGRLFVFIMTQGRSMSYMTQFGPDEGWGPIVNLLGHHLLWPCGIGRADDGRLEVACIGGDRKLYSRWQVDAGRPDLFRDWTDLGGRDIRPGVSLSPNAAGQLELFVVGGDGALYRGPRPSQ